MEQTKKTQKMVEKAAARGSRPLEVALSGILATSDSHERLRLCFVDALGAPEGRSAPDHSWARLRDAISAEGSGAPPHNVPYVFPQNGAPDGSGIRGECWVTLPTASQGPRGRAARERRARILALAGELRGKEVVLTVRPKRYSFVSQAAHNRGATVTGTSLSFVGLEPRHPGTFRTEGVGEGGGRKCRI